MPLPREIVEAYTAILKEELLVAMGCTEPIAIAYAAAILRETLGAEPERIQARLSGNIIKNVKSVIVPATGGLHGIEAAIAAGIIAACPEKQLEVLTVLKPQDRYSIAAFLTRCGFTVDEMESPLTFDLELTGWAGNARSSVRIAGNHTNVVSVKRDGDDLTRVYSCSSEAVHTKTTDRSVLNVQDILTFASETPLDELQTLLERQAQMNMEGKLRCVHRQGSLPGWRSEPSGSGTRLCCGRFGCQNEWLRDARGNYFRQWKSGDYSICTGGGLRPGAGQEP